MNAETPRRQDGNEAKMSRAETRRRGELHETPPRLCVSARDISFCFFLIALTLLAYLPALRAGFIWDDDDYVTANPTLHDAAGLGLIWTDQHANVQYYPLVFTTFWFEYHAWGLIPLGYHVDNILIHSFSAILLWRLLLRLELPPLAAWLAAAIFAVHPVEVESVAWVTERKNVLCGLFYLVAMLVYFSPRRGRAQYVGAAALFLCAMLSKTVAATWPLAVLVILWWRNGKLRGRDYVAMVPFALIGAVLGWLTSLIEKGQVGAGGKDWDFSFADRCIIAGRAVWFYAIKAIVPARLTFIYPRWDLSAERAIQATAAASAAILLIVLVLQIRRLGRGPAAAAILFVLTLGPALGFVDYYPMRFSFVANHFQYLAIIAVIVPAAVLLVRWFGGGATVILVPLVVLTFLQCRIYRDRVALWSDTSAKNPFSWMAHVNLGEAWDEIGQIDAAGPEFVEATELAGDEPDTWYHLAEFQAKHRRYAEAEASFRHALLLNPNDDALKRDLQKVLKIEAGN